MCLIATQTKAAHAKVDSLLTLLQTTQSSDKKIDIYITLAQISSISNIENGIKWAKDGLVLAEKTHNIQGTVACKQELGYGYGMIGEYDVALQYLQSALDSAEKYALIYYVCNLYNTTGTVFSNKGDYYKAQIHFQEGLQRALQNNIDEATAVSCNNLGLLLSKQGKYASALTYFLEAERWYDKVGLPKHYLLNNIASLYFKQGNLDLASEYVTRALVINQKTEDKKGLSVSYDISGQIELAKANYKQALSFFENALAIKSESENKTELIDTYNYLGDVYQRLNEWDNALKNYESSINLCTQLNTTDGLAYAYLHKAMIAVAQNNYQLATLDAQKAIKIALKEVTPSQLQKGEYTLSDIDADNLDESYFVLARIYEAENQPTTAIQSLQIAQMLSDSLSNSKIARSLNDLRTKFEIINKNAEIKDLQIEQEQQTSLLRSKQLQRNTFMIGACILTIVLVVLIITSYQKGRNNLLLQQRYTEQKILQMELEQKNTELTQQSITKDKLFSIISHDIRTPINGLKSMLTLLASGQIPSFMLTDLSDKLQKNIDNVSATIDNLLNWSISQMNGIETQPEQVNVWKIAAEIENMYQTTAEAKKIKIINKIEKNALIIADIDHLRLLLRNLVGNALKFTPKGGSITLSSDVFGNGQTAISISDTGVGMSNEKLNKLFKVETHFTEYGTAKEKGAGLGLLLCKEFVEKNKGSIWVTSEEGKGSTFSFSLPSVLNESMATNNIQPNYAW